MYIYEIVFPCSKALNLHIKWDIYMAFDSNISLFNLIIIGIKHEISFLQMVQDVCHCISL